MNLNLIFTLSTFLAKWDSKEIQKLLDLHKSIFNKSNFFMDFLHWLGWGIVKGLCWLMDACKVLVDVAYDTLDFMNFAEIEGLETTLRPIAFSILALAIGYLAYVYLLAPEKPKTIGVNIALLCITMIGLPWCMDKLNYLTLEGRNLMTADSSTSGWSIVQPYVTDVYYLDGQTFYQSDSYNLKGKELNGYAGNLGNLEDIDISEKINMDEQEYKDGVTNDDVFKKYLKNGKDGKKELKKIEEDFLGFGWYYRYKVDYLLIYINQLAIIFVYLLTAIKVVMLMFELTTQKVLSPLFASGDLASGQRIKSILTGIINGYVVLFIVSFLQKIYFIWSSYVASKTFVDNEFEGFVKAVLVLIGALLIVDGPNWVEKACGIDAGLKSVAQSIQSAYYASQMAGSIAQAGGKLANAVGKPLGKVAGAVGSAGAKAGAYAVGSAYEGAKSLSSSLKNTLQSGQNKATTGEGSNINNTSTNTNSVNSVNNESSGASGRVNESVSTTNSSQSQPTPSPTNQNKQTGTKEGQKGVSGGVSDYLKQELGKKGSDIQHKASDVGNKISNSSIGQSFQKGRELGQAVNTSAKNVSDTLKNNLNINKPKE